MVIDLRQKNTEIMPLKINDQIIEHTGILEKLHWSDHINNFQSILMQTYNSIIYFFRILGQFKIYKTLITIFYKSVIGKLLSLCITC